MSNLDGHRADPRHESTLNESRSKDAVDLGLVRALNERCLELMVRLARSDHERAPPAVSLNRALWCGLDTSARQRAASYSLLLLNVNFGDPAWWHWAAENRSSERKAGTGGYFQPKVASELMRETITLAWIIARADQGKATIFCGMAPAVARMFSSFSPLDLERLSARHHCDLRLRFADRPSYWRRHLTISGSKSVAGSPNLELNSGDRQQSLF